MRCLWTLSLMLACVQAPKHTGDGIPGDLSAGQDSGATKDPPVDTAGASDTGPADPGGELRGIWVTRWTYSTAGDVAEIMSAIADAGFNTVFFQVRGRHDAYYASTIEPWAQRLSGTPSHAYLSNPEWLVADVEGTPMALNSSYVFASPGNPEVRARIAAVSADVASRYAVDGIHLDYIRYPGSGYSHDVESLYRWEGAGEPDWEQWQREQVTATVQGVSDAVDIPVTAAVWGIYENSFGWSGVSQGNQDYFQDSRAFLSTGALDANIPMIYWPVADEEGAHLDFRVLVRDHLDHASGRHVYAGISAAPSLGQSGVIRCIEVAREEGAHGVVLFDYSQALPFFDTLKSSVFSEPADPPPMLWR
jgi:uncharacterized lipoprotein YddW (UPF0748 family)